MRMLAWESEQREGEELGEGKAGGGSQLNGRIT